MRTAVVILGFSSWASGRPHPVQRWRVEVGVRAALAAGADTVVVSGGAVRNSVVEADTMAALAQQMAPGLEVVREREARSTWENVALTYPLVERFDVVILASDRFHAGRAQRYWKRQFPQHTGSVRIADDGPWHRHLWIRVPSAVYETVRRGRERAGREGVSRRR